MSDASPNGMHSQRSDGSTNQNEVIQQLRQVPQCVKLTLDENIEAFVKKRKLERDIDLLQCSPELCAKVATNYIIVKQILSNLCWQEKLVCEQVCTTWRSAIHALKKEQLSPVDFAVDLRPLIVTWALMKASQNFVNEPMAVMTFVNGSGIHLMSECELIVPGPCETPCSCFHSLLDLVHKFTSAPKDCMNLIRADYISYMPQPTAPTYKHTITHLKTTPHIVGLSIPMIPDVKTHSINIKSMGAMQKQFYDVVTDIAKDRIFKGILIYVTDKYILQSVEDIVFLNHFKTLQPDIPYALGGCIIEDTIFDEAGIKEIVDGINSSNDFYSETLISMTIFTVPKSPGSNEFNFDMYSLVIDSSEWQKPKIQQSIKEFAKKVPQFEHSAAIKLSCVGRDKKHKAEQELFREGFPNTRLVGCYGNGELGINHPEIPPVELPNPSAKRQRSDPGPEFGIMYSYSTVFVYMGWGRVLSTGQS